MIGCGFTRFGKDKEKQKHDVITKIVRCVRWELSLKKEKKRWHELSTLIGLNKVIQLTNVPYIAFKRLNWVPQNDLEHLLVLSSKKVHLMQTPHKPHLHPLLYFFYFGFSGVSLILFKILGHLTSHSAFVYWPLQHRLQGLLAPLGALCLYN